MFPIAEARFLAPEVKLFRIAAPRIARKRKTTKLMNRLLQQRNAMYRDAEAESLRAFLEDPEKELGRVRESCQLHEVNA